MRNNRRLPSPAIAVALAAASLAACADTDDAGDRAAGDTMMADTQTVEVADAGFMTPESVLHDDRGGVYLVSNINGSPVEKDGNGFISRVRPDGSVEQIRWIDGASDGITLHAPKGLAVRGDTLFVSDIDSVRAFDRGSGEALGARGVPGATFLNDLTVGPDGLLYVSDSGLNPDFSSSGTDAIYRFDGNEAVAVAEGTELSGPNGIVAFDDMLAMVTFGASQIRLVRAGSDADGSSQIMAELPGGQLDGIVRLDDGSFLVSSWESQAVFRVPAGGGQASEVVSGVPSPADIGFDEERARVLIPVFQEDRLVFEPIG